MANHFQAKIGVVKELLVPCSITSAGIGRSKSTVTAVSAVWAKRPTPETCKGALSSRVLPRTPSCSSKFRKVFSPPNHGLQDQLANLYVHQEFWCAVWDRQESHHDLHHCLSWTSIRSCWTWVGHIVQQLRQLQSRGSTNFFTLFWHLLLLSARRLGKLVILSRLIFDRLCNGTSKRLQTWQQTFSLLIMCGCNNTWTTMQTTSGERHPLRPLWQNPWLQLQFFGCRSNFGRRRKNVACFLQNDRHHLGHQRIQLFACLLLKNCGVTQDHHSSFAWKMMQH